MHSYTCHTLMFTGLSHATSFVSTWCQPYTIVRNFAVHYITYTAHQFAFQHGSTSPIATRAHCSREHSIETANLRGEGASGNSLTTSSRKWVWFGKLTVSEAVPCRIHAGLERHCIVYAPCTRSANTLFSKARRHVLRVVFQNFFIINNLLFTQLETITRSNEITQYSAYIYHRHTRKMTL